MKKITLLLLLIALGTYLGAQTLDTVRIVSKARRFSPNKHILLSFEVMDTVDASGKNITMSRSYYFDRQSRMISSVRENYNPKDPKNGTQVIYIFGGNKLASVTVIPPRSTCRKCETRYYYVNDSLSSKQENAYSNANSATYLAQAHYFQAKLPQDLPWGYFDDEVLVNGRKKKVKRSY
jgi:hypothetical protein